MKRRDFIKHLTKYKCTLYREGANHSIYKNQSGVATAVPRHPEIDDYTIKSICKQLDIPLAGKN